MFKEERYEEVENNRDDEVENPEVERVIVTEALLERYKKSFPKPGDRIQYKIGDEWQSAEVLRRGGKASSKVTMIISMLEMKGSRTEVYI